uniref:Uncharacterized protein n=1 Tax=Euplotes crassus TaxID=5936 RepID=A0A7S3KKY2_EUPCR|mmetsp:Transcript_27690/g.27558  ORF Transcript_27690/g.27558 Transcript_27690/m.27558 type:complete len:158 (+) Transcript_27690:305-778(+)
MRAPKLRALSLDSNDSIQDFMLPTAALNTMDMDGNMPNFGTSNNQVSLDTQSSQLQSGFQLQDGSCQSLQLQRNALSDFQFQNNEEIGVQQDLQDLGEEELILSDNQDKPSSQCQASKFILGASKVQENPGGVSMQSGYKPQTILGFLSSQVSTRLT